MFRFRLRRSPGLSERSADNSFDDIRRDPADICAIRYRPPLNGAGDVVMAAMDSMMEGNGVILEEATVTGGDLRWNQRFQLDMFGVRLERGI